MNKVSLYLVALHLLFLAEAPPARAQAGNAGMTFLKLGVSGRGVGMGDAMAGHVSAAAATYYNPAGVLADPSTNSGSQLMFMHKEWIQDTRTEFLGASLPLGSDDALGFSLNTMTVSGIEIRTRPGPPDGTFTSRDLALGVSYARGLSEDLRVGLTAKYLYEKIFIDETSGYAFDLGAQYKTPIENLSIGAAAANLGRVNGYRGGTLTLPALVRIGPAYSGESQSMHAVSTLAIDLLYIFPERHTYVNAGGEIVFNRMLAVRAGYEAGSQGRGLSGGVGLQYGILALDYAFARLSADLGDTHTISLSLNL